MSETVDTSFMSQPTGTEDASLGDNRIRAFKLAWKERMEKEHNMDLTEAGSQPRQGLHKAGSAVSFYQASAPTTRNGIALSSSDAGLSWVDSDTNDLYVWNGTNWVHVGGPGSASDYRFQGKIERITSGSGDWTVPDGVYRIRVTCVGGGGGGGGGSYSPDSSTSGSNGNATTFTGSTTGNGGFGGGNGSTNHGDGGAGAAGGAGAGGNSCGGLGNYSGGAGGGAGGYAGPISTHTGGAGGFGGGGGGGYGTYGGGGGGGGTNISLVLGTVMAVTPGQAIAYSVGAGGAGGAAGGAAGYAGGAGGSGIIIIEY